MDNWDPDYLRTLPEGQPPGWRDVDVLRLREEGAHQVAHAKWMCFRGGANGRCWDIFEPDEIVSQYGSMVTSRPSGKLFLGLYRCGARKSPYPADGTPPPNLRFDGN